MSWFFFSSFQVMASSVQGWVRNEFFILDFVFVFHEFLIVLSKHIEYQDPIGLEKILTLSKKKNWSREDESEKFNTYMNFITITEW